MHISELRRSPQTMSELPRGSATTVYYKIQLPGAVHTVFVRIMHKFKYDLHLRWWAPGMLIAKCEFLLGAACRGANNGDLWRL